jgi:hypothetical protein
MAWERSICMVTGGLVLSAFVALPFGEAALAQPAHVPPMNNPGTSAAGRVLAPALEGGSATERANRIHERAVDRRLDTIERRQGENERLRQEQRMRREGTDLRR